MADTKDYPKKLYYSISEVAGIAGVKAHVLRYWESEFPTLKPRKTRSGSRRYRQSDIDEVLLIKSLLYDRGFKIAGARKALREEKAAARSDDAPATQMALGFDAMSDAEKLQFVKKELTEVLDLVKQLKKAETGKPKEMKGKG